MKSEWFDSAFEDFLADLVESSFDDDVPADVKKFLKLAYVAGAREALAFSEKVLQDELLGY